MDNEFFKIFYLCKVFITEIIYLIQVQSMFNKKKNLAVSLKSVVTLNCKTPLCTIV